MPGLGLRDSGLRFTAFSHSACNLVHFSVVRLTISGLIRVLGCRVSGAGFRV